MTDTQTRAAANQKAAVKYIQHLAACTNTDITDWEIPSLFSKEGGGIHTDKRKINQIFFAALDGSLKPKEFKRNAIPLNVFTSLNKVLPSQAEIDKLENNIVQYLNQVQNYTHDLYRVFNSISSARDKIDSLSGKKILLGVELDKALHSNDFFEFFLPVTRTSHGKQNVHGVLLQTKPYVLKHRNSAAKVNESLEMPRLMLYMTTNLLVKVVPPWAAQFFCNFEGSVPEHILSRSLSSTDSFIWHPHINASNICLGNMSNDMAKYIITFNISRILELIEAVVTSYNHSNPYISLTDLVSRIKEIKEVTASIKTAQDYLDNRTIKNTYALNWFTFSRDWANNIISYKTDNQEVEDLDPEYYDDVCDSLTLNKEFSL